VNTRILIGQTLLLTCLLAFASSDAFAKPRRSDAAGPVLSSITSADAAAIEASRLMIRLF
jgi:hypothetical protein